MTHSQAPEVRDQPAAGHAPLEALPPQDDFFPASADVARRAYIHFQNHGAANGRDLHDWLQAEAELTAEWQLTGS